MQHIDENMDDLYRKAAEEYPLNIRPDWEAMQRKLYTFEDQQSRISDNTFVGRKRQVSLLALILLIPLGLIVADYFIREKETEIVRNSKDKNIETFRRKVDQKAPVDNAITNEGSKDLSAQQEEKQKVPEITENSFAAITKNKKEIIASISHIKESRERNFANNIHLPINSDLVQIRNFSTESTNTYSAIKQSRVMGEKLLRVVNTNVGKQNNESKRSNAFEKQKRFYIGAIVAPELSSIKFQPVKKKGFNLGVIMGYSLNDHFNIELGITLAHKYFFTDGKYVPANSISGDNSKILNVNAFSSITEIPLSLRYNINPAKKRTFFTTIGSVSDVIHKEHYDFLYARNGEEGEGRNYNNKASRFWFSNVQVSMGYECEAGKVGKFRVEPYYRIPVNGIGISDLPITSIGLNVALTRNIK